MKQHFVNVFLILVFLLPGSVFATKRTWIGTTSTWSVSSNWSGGTPGTSDTALFNNAANCSITSTINVKCIQLVGYTGTITQSAAITIGTSGFSMNGGTFTGGSSSITVGGPFSVTGGTFTATSGTMTLASDFTYSGGTFTHNSGTVVVNSTASGVASFSGSPAFSTLTFTSTVSVNTTSVTITSGTITVNSTLTITGTGGTYVNSGNIDAKGNVSLGPNNCTSNITLSGGNSQTLTGNTGSIGNIVINKTAGTLTLSGTIYVSGNWTFTSIGSGSLSPGSSTINFTGTPTISGTHTLNNLTVTQTCTVSNTVSLNGNLTIAGTSTLTINTGTFDVAGNVIITNTVAAGGGTGTISLSGSATQSLTANNGSTAYLCNLTFNKSGGGVSLTYTTTVSGTINFNGSANYTIDNGTSGNLQANGDLVFASISYVNGGTGLITIAGTGSQAFTGNSGPTGKLPKVTINKASGTLTLSNSIGIANDWTYTAGTLSTGSSTVLFYDNLTIGGGNHTLAGVTFTNTAGSTITLANTTTLTVSGTLKTAGSNTMNINTGGSGTINFTGTTFSVTNSASGGGGTATISLSGTGNQTVTANSGTTGSLCNFQDNKTGGNIVLNNAIPVAGNLDFTGSTLHFMNNGSNGDLQAYANVTMASGAQISGGTGLVSFRGANNQTLTGNTGGNGTFPSVTINKSGGTLSIVNNTRILGNIVYTAGTVNPGTSQLLIMANGTTSYSITAASPLNLYNVQLSNVTSVSPTGTLTLIGDVNFNDLTINASRGRFAGGSGTITVTGNWTDNNLFYCNTGTVVFAGSASTNTISGTESPKTFYNVSFNKSASHTLTVADAITATGTLTYGGTSQLTVNTGTINASGDITVTNTVTTGGGSTFLNINGGNAQAFTGLSGNGYPFKDITINKSSNTITFSNNIYMTGNLTYTAGTVATATTSTMNFIGTGQTINTGSVNLYNVTFNPGSTATHTVSNTLNVTKTLTYGGTSQLTVNTGTINASGDITVTNTVTTGGGSTLLNITGTGTQTLTSSSTGTVTPGPLGPIAISKTGGTLTLSNNINAGGDWTYSATSTTLTPGSSSVIFTKTSPTITGSHTLNTITFAPTAASTVTVSNALTLNSNLNYNNQNTITVNTGTINVGGNITITDTASGGGGSALINISGSSTQTITQSGVLQGNSLPNVTINKTGTLVLANNKNVWVKGNWTYITAGAFTTTGSGMVFNGTSSTITGNQTLNSLAVASTAATTLTIASGNTVTLTGTLGFYGNSTIALNTGTINARGNIAIYNTSTGSTFGNATILINGTGAQTFSCSTGAPVIPNLTINKTAGTLTVTGSEIAIGGNLVHTAGTVNVDTTNKVTLYGTASINASAITFGSIDIKGVRSLGADLNLYKNMHIISNTLNASGTAYNINIQGDWTNDATFASGTGYLRFTGTKSQTVSESSGDTIAKIKMDKASGNITLNSLVTVTDSLKFIKGNIITTSTNLLALNKRAGITGAGASTGFVSGPVKKTGNSLFTFPTGKGTNYQPIKISAPSSATDAFTAEYFNANQAYGSILDTLLDTLSTCEYWNLDRTVGTSSVSITLGWNANSCNVDSASNMRVSYWNGSLWQNLGGTSITGNHTGGTVTSGSVVGLYGHFTLGHYFYCHYLLSLAAHAGPDHSIFLGSSITIGGNPIATGTSLNPSLIGVSWSPSVTNPNAAFTGSGLCGPSVTTVYTVTVTYGTCIVKDNVIVYVDQLPPVALLKNKPDGEYYRVYSNKLYFKIDEQYNSTGLVYNVYDKTNAIVASSSGPDIASASTLDMGDNRLYLDVNSSTYPAGYYLLEVINEKNEKLYLRFKK